MKNANQKSYLANNKITQKHNNNKKGIMVLSNFHDHHLSLILTLFANPNSCNISSIKSFPHPNFHLGFVHTTKTQTQV